MSILVLDQQACERLLAERREMGGDRYDEVWEGLYVMGPLANLEHQRLVGALTNLCYEVVSKAGLGDVYPGANVTDPAGDWEQNYRCPDVVVVLKGGRARSIGAALVGGPDFLIEIRSSGDQTLETLPFYEVLQVRELLVVDRDSKELELFALQKAALASKGRSTAADPQMLASEVLPLTFQWLAGNPPHMHVRRSDAGAGSWTV